LPRAIENPAPGSAREHLRLPFVRLKPQLLPGELHHPTLANRLPLSRRAIPLGDSARRDIVRRDIPRSGILNRNREGAAGKRVIPAHFHPTIRRGVSGRSDDRAPSARTKVSASRTLTLPCTTSPDQLIPHPSTPCGHAGIRSPGPLFEVK
jgi:hypothetical protein